MTQLIGLFFGLVLALRLYLTYKRVFVKPGKISSENFYGNDQIKDILENDLTWKGYENKYDAEIVKKRRSKFLSMYNEMRTMDEYFVEKPLEVSTAAQKFYKRITNLKIYPARAFRMIVIPLLFCTDFGYTQNQSSEMLFDYNLWLKYENDEENVCRIHTNRQLEFSHVSENKEVLNYNQLLYKIRLLETNPSTVLNKQNP
jgi:hypothetical protein